ncbi:unnamed protein product [Porites lobata]|uniref:J domain-containing protein n=1 Tax=Porites lobata TaxID=104759 RepID=A0ABN8SA51_9CNID|nr:unnamed protein product [Porites lobata]
MKGKQRSLLVVNESSEAYLKLKLYFRGDLVCYMPHTSRVFKPNEKFFYTTEWQHKLELVALFQGRKKPKKVLLKPQQWVGKRYVKITESLDVIEDDLSFYPELEKEGLRKWNRDKELEFTDGQRNLYGILRLDEDEVRAMSRGEQDKEITRAFLRELQIWHPDHNEDGDDEVVRELIWAYGTLQDREKRARYNNLADYDKGWLSGKRFKAVFWPECETMAQSLAWKKRMGLLALSAGLTIGGIVAVVLTAGFSCPLLLSVISGGINSLSETISKEAVLDGCNVKQWLLSTGIGCLLASLPGGAAIATSLILKSAALSVSEFTGIRIAIAAGCATASSLGTDAKKYFIDGREITTKQAVCHATCQCAAAVAATLVGLVLPRLCTSSKKLANRVHRCLIKQRCLLEQLPVPSTSKVTRVLIEKGGELAEKLSDDAEELPDEIFPYSPTTLLLRKRLSFKSSHNKIGGLIMYICNGWWLPALSQMIVSYIQDDKEVTKKVRGNRKQIKLTENAKEIKVRFKIWRPTSGWGHVNKYNRFARWWCQPYEPHVFHYPTPVTRTFTIEGTLWWEAVMKVTDEHHNEKEDI